MASAMEQEQQALVAWLRQRGGLVHESVDLFHAMPGGDRSVVALADIEEGEQLMLVPLECALHVPTASDVKSCVCAAGC